MTVRQALIALLLVVSLTEPALARPMQVLAKAQARALLRDGVRHFKAHRYERALEKFEEAYRKFPSAKLLVNIGAAYRQMGRPVEALDAYERFLRDTGTQVPATRAQVEMEARALAGLVGELHVDAPDGTEALIEGRSLGKTPMPAVRLKAASYRVVLLVPQRESVEVPADIFGGQSTVIRPPAPPEPATAPPPTRPAPDLPALDAAQPAPPEVRTALPAPSAAPSKSTRWLAWGTTGLGVALAGVGTVFGLKALSSNGEAQDCYDAGVWNEGCRQALDRRDRFAPLSYAFIGVGAATAVAGGAWIYMLHKQARRAGTTSVRLQAAREGALVALQFVR